MSAGAKLEYHTKAVFTLKSLEDGSTLTFSVSTLQESTVSDVVWPTLKTVGNIGTSMGDYLPSTSSSSLTIDNSHGSIGFERKFSDLFDRYTIINQQVLIYVAASSIGAFSSGDYELRWAGTVKRTRQRGDDLVIDIAGRGIQDRVVNTLVSREVFATGDTTYVDRAAGQALPIVIGSNVQVKPILISAYATSQADYVYATNLRTYACEGVQSIFVKGHDGEYYEVQSAPTYNTDLFGSSYNAGKSNAAWSANTEYAHRFQIPDPGYIAYSAHVYVYKAAGVAAGDIEIAIQTDDYLQQGSSANWGRAPGTVIARGNYQLDQLNAAAGAYKVQVAFDKHAVLQPGQNWFLTYRLKNDTTGRIGVYYDAAITEAQFYKTTDGTLWMEDAAANRRYWGVNAIEIADYNAYGSPSDNVAGWFQLFQSTMFNEVPNLTTLDFILEVNGLCDDSSGTITGTPNQLIESPQHAVELLTKQFNGTTYTGGQFGTEHSATWGQVNSSSSQYYRKLAYKTAGTTKLTQLLEQICRGTASRITMHPNASTPLGYWAWGSKQDVVDDISQDDCEVLNVEILGTETIVNTVEMFYAEKLTPLDYVTGNALGEFKSYSARFSSTEEAAAAFDLCDRITSVSRDIFGDMKLQNQTFPMIGDSTSAQNVGISLVARNTFPSVFVDIEGPFERFKARKILDKVRFTHPEVPAFFGTTPKASKAVYLTNGVEVDLSTGFHWARANTVEAIVEALQIVYDSENTPRIRMSLKIKTSPHDPT